MVSRIPSHIWNQDSDLCNGTRSLPVFPMWVFWFLTTVQKLAMVTWSYQIGCSCAWVSAPCNGWVPHPAWAPAFGPQALDPLQPWIEKACTVQRMNGWWTTMPFKQFIIPPLSFCHVSLLDEQKSICEIILSSTKLNSPQKVKSISYPPTPRLHNALCNNLKITIYLPLNGLHVSSRVNMWDSIQPGRWGSR